MRKTAVSRNTKETKIDIELNLDGGGKSAIDSSVPFLDHMLTLFCTHGLFDARIKARGDIDIDFHHTVEDIGIVLGKAVRQALKDMKGITRYGFASVPMDETLAEVSIDVSGRPFLVYRVEFPKKSRLKNFDPDLIEDFFHAFVGNAGVTLHINVSYGRNTHHIIEAIFKAFARALRQAVALDPRTKGVPSTKGTL